MKSRYHLGRAVASGIANAIPFVVIPVLILRTLPSLLGPVLPAEVVNELLSLEATIIPLGAAVTILAALTAFHGRGLVGRGAFGTGRQLAKLAWVYFVFPGGLISLSVLGFSLFVEFQRLLYVLYAALLLMALHFVAEYFVYRHRHRMAPYPMEYDTGGPY
ncbi:MAG: hypothetical protein ACE5LS_06120 [Thermoplasmata archaeon]